MLSYLGFDSRSPRYLSLVSTKFLVAQLICQGRLQLLGLTGYM
jgi:hypothetical protein